MPGLQITMQLNKGMHLRQRTVQWYPKSWLFILKVLPQTLGGLLDIKQGAEDIISSWSLFGQVHQ